VNAPGRPTRTIDLFLAKSARLYFLGGKPRCNSTLGNLSPTDAKLRVATLVFHTNEEEEEVMRGAMDTPRRRPNNKDDMVGKLDSD